MLWLVNGQQSEQIVACNIHRNGKNFELWVERGNGKTRKIRSGSNEEVMEIKEAIDFAIREGHKSLEL